MSCGKNWTSNEVEYLTEHFGTVSVPAIAKSLNRSVTAILMKRQHLGLGPFLDNGDYLTLNQLYNALGFSNGSGYRNTSWIKNRGFPVHTKRVCNNTFKIVYIHEFWVWAEENQNFLDFSNFEANMLGAEPEWVKFKRVSDYNRKKQYRTSPWTHAEDDRLKKYLQEYKYGYSELSKRLNRTEGSIQRRICDLGLRERPIKADNHIKWTAAEFETVGNMINACSTYEEMSAVIEKSAKAIRGKVYTNYLTEDLCKVRQMLKGQTFGANKPQFTLKHFIIMPTEEKCEAKQLLSNLCATLLSQRLNKTHKQEEFSE